MAKAKQPPVRTIFGRTKDYLPPPEHVLKAVDGMTGLGIRRACGCGEKAAYALKEGRPLPRLVLDEVERNLMHREDGTLRVRMENIMTGPVKGAQITIGRLQMMAEIVQAYRKKFPLTYHMRLQYVFPPKSIIKQLAEAFEAAHGILKQLHKECPEFDHVIFKNAVELWREISGKEGEPTRKKTVRKPRRKRKSARPRVKASQPKTLLT